MTASTYRTTDRPTVKVGHAVEHLYAAVTCLYLLWLAHHFYFDHDTSPSIPAMVAVLGFMVCAHFLSQRWHRSCTTCLARPRDPERAVRRNSGWLTISHMPAITTAITTATAPAIGYVVGVAHRPTHFFALGCLGLAASIALVFIARRQHQRLQSWCMICLPDRVLPPGTPTIQE